MTNLGRDGLRPVPSTVTFGTDPKLGSEADFESAMPVAVEIPAGFEGTSISFKVLTPTQPSGIPVNNEDGTLYSLTVAAAGYYPIPAQIGMALKAACVYCGTNQTANRDVIIWCRELR